MKSRFTKFAAMSALLLCILSPAWAAKKPLKVFILVGQSNMEGHAQVTTFPAIAKDPKTVDLYKDMVDAQGKPVVCDHVWIADSYGDFGGNPAGTKSGKLTAGWGSQHNVGAGKIGPEFTFGIYMNKMLGEPVLLIKTAWGGKSLKVDFRPPSGGEPTDPKDKEKAGKYYGLMMEYVKQVLADPKRVCPDYDPAAGFELAGFVWFQGFNDLVGNYPQVDPKIGKKGIRDYSEYSRLLSCLIRDVRKDLSAPKLPFVIGVMGIGGATTNAGMLAFRKAMAAPAETGEFKGKVVNVFTEKYWPVELDAVLAKAQPIKNEFKKKKDQSAAKKSGKGEPAKDEELNAELAKVLTEDELFLLNNGFSNKDFHYHGSAKFFAQTGKAFAEALAVPAP